MSDVVLVVGEIIVGLALLTMVGGAVAVVTTRLLGKTSPEDVARERYARGELTREQYERMLGDLDLPRMLGTRSAGTPPNGHGADVISAGKTR